MPRIAVNGTELYYEDSGTPSGGSATGQAIIFSHGLLMNCAMFAGQVAALRARYRCIAYDHRGQGKSAASDMRCIDMETVAADGAALIEALGVGPVHFCGLSMGGFVAMRLAARRPELLRSIILLETSAQPEPAENVGSYKKMNAVARWLHFRLVAPRVMPIMFGQTLLTAPGRDADRAAARAMLFGNRRDIWRAVNGVIERKGIEEEITRIRVPTLIAVGDEDVATKPEKAEAIAAAIPGAKLVRIPRAGHSSSMEEPAFVSNMIAEFLQGLIA
ncbi:MAG: alpha/beta hydrolase [Burkholderiaceae bacterium]|nr:alpha/beta hydrolase [Burkholderiaceae bacterium]